MADDDASETRVVVLVRGGDDKAAQAHREKGTSGKAMVALDLRLDDRTRVKLRAAPEAYGELVQLKLVRQEPSAELEDCELAWMLNGQPRSSPKVYYARKGTTSSLRSEIPSELVRDLGAARQFALRACDLRWSLDEDQLAEIRRFVTLYEEELAWKGSPRGGTGGLLAPSGGWPEWKVTGAAPPAEKDSAALDAQTMFKQLAPSVFQIEALLQNGTSQGSAVAVSGTDLLTNCHVVQGARKVIVKQGKREWLAQLERADPARDRCVLRAPEAAFEPVHGVRDLADLEVGERLYTLGSPNGLELSLADGILSGVREEDGAKYVQTTAPISPGSSGGGLFDARGNLVGITTMILVGKARLNQALNFAIPAATYWQP